jgi:hypothetical protein
LEATTGVRGFMPELWLLISRLVEVRLLAPPPCLFCSRAQLVVFFNRKEMEPELGMLADARMPKRGGMLPRREGKRV